MRRFSLAAMLLAFAGTAQAAPKPAWTDYADCAGAYVANARVADPDRPATMTSQMNDVADDYFKAAAAAYQRRTGTTRIAARVAVAGRVKATADRLGKQPREAAEKIIDACPQTDG